jgi:acetolactate synthase-1/3 small subunit
MEDKSLVIVLADNKPGMLANITKIFSQNNLNIDSLSLSKINWDNTIHRTTAYLQGQRSVTEKACKELETIKGVKKVVNFMTTGEHMERELGMVKILNNDPKLGDAVRIAGKYGASTIFTNDKIMIFEITDFEEKISEFIAEISKECTVEVMRSGIVATTLDENLISHK